MGFPGRAERTITGFWQNCSDAPLGSQDPGQRVQFELPVLRSSLCSPPTGSPLPWVTTTSTRTMRTADFMVRAAWLAGFGGLLRESAQRLVAIGAGQRSLADHSWADACFAV